MAQPNLLFIFPDQLSARWVGCYGHPVVSTPRIDTFAEESTVFTQAYSTSPVCTPYRGCLLTGRYPSQTGVMRNGMALPEDMTTVAHRLNDAGYTTYYVGKWHLSGDPQQNRWVPPHQRGGLQHFTGWESHHVDHWDGLIWRDDPDDATTLDGHETDGLTQIVLDHFGRCLQEPFCMFVSYQAPHPPCSPPETYRVLYRDRDLMVEPNVQPDAYYYQPQWNADYDLQEFRERYYGEITQIDAAFGQILDGLEQHGLAENTVVIFTSDHGEMNGSHGLFSKGVMYDESMRVPLLVRLPGQSTEQRIDLPVSTVDFLPTLLELGGAEPDVGAEGRSLVPVLRGHALEPRPIFSEYEDVCVIYNGWKLVAERDPLRVKALYHLENDPYELNNRLSDNETQATQMRQLLVEWVAYLDKTSLESR